MISAMIHRHAGLLAAVLAVAVRAGAEAPGPSPSPCPDVVARVDGRPITLRAIRLIAELKLRSAAGLVREDAYHDATNTRIRRELLAFEAARQGLSAEPSRVQDAEKIAREGFADEKAWLAFLSHQGLDADAYREEAWAEGRADSLMACEIDGVPRPGDAETIRLFHIYVQPNNPEPPSPDALEHWRNEFWRKKQSMAGRELLMRLMSQAKIERYFEPGTCAP
jgi:hypothetical protein